MVAAILVGPNPISHSNNDTRKLRSQISMLRPSLHDANISWHSGSGNRHWSGYIAK